ncbi:MAG: PAS domain S-box protein [Ignavibacteria bacterium]|nr:PAS domain S-box protein [Ignavibacteria bacterium]
MNSEKNHFRDMRINKFTLSFKDSKEKAYQQYYFKDSLIVFRVALILVTFLYGFFALLDVTVAPAQKEYLFIIRFVFVIPYLLIVFGLSFFKFFKKIWQILLFFSFILGGTGIILMIVRMPDNLTYYAGLMLVFSAGYFFVKLRFIYATVAGWITLLIFVCAAVWFSSIPRELIIAYSFFYISANLISMFAAYYIEYFNRKNFFLTNQLNQNKIELQELNTNLESQVKARTEQLATSEKKFRTLVEKANDIIFSITKEGLFTYVSPNWKGILGHDADEVIGKSFIDFIHLEDINGFTKLLNSFEEPDRSNVYFEYRVKHNNGEWKWHVSSFTPQFNQEGKVDSLIGIAHDVSERKMAESAVIQSQRLSAIGEMASAVAHDFNNSLQIIFSNLEIALLDKNISHQTKKYLETIKTSATDASSRVQLLQRFSGKKQHRTRYEKVSLNKIVEDVIVQSRPLWKDRQEEKGSEISIQTKYSEMPSVYGNEGELRSVLYNLVKNSIEAMPEGGKLYFETGLYQNGAYVQITDSGIGMDEETKTRVFQPFFTTKGFEIGRGLGMSGAYSIIKEHKGELKIIDTAPGKGTTIEIFLPLPKEKIVNQEKIAVEEFTGTAKILWVDDEPMIQEIAKDLIDALGHQGTLVSSGQEALDQLDQNEFDLVITDIGMPRMNGWQLADKINERFGGKVKIAALTGWGNQFDDDERTSHKIDFVLSKPIKINELRLLINKAMKLNK